ncbi:hypothetical protein K435DRAFT_784737 [Dendrothele bispora CBS 962.96]|uniref:Uncharacterized protein n=1 Tax=Dendrothele bispora (strain CBS 962.96) TaxID=1314807 RepID=A0A4S8L102_DENBC|nr:hypothetical protein K435DRAFT_784737 [Dendrothele bispora CBS 962.96]
MSCDTLRSSFANAYSINPSRFVSSSLRGSSIHRFSDVSSLFVTKNPLPSSPSSLLHCSLVAVLRFYLFRLGRLGLGSSRAVTLNAFLLLLVEFVAVTALDHNTGKAIHRTEEG